MGKSRSSQRIAEANATKNGRKPSFGKPSSSEKNKEGNNEEQEFLFARRELTDKTNPFFMVKPWKTWKNGNALRVPTTVIKEFNLEFPSKISFLDPNGRQWQSTVTKWRDGRVVLKGWNAFCKWNRVTQNQKIICEILLEKKAVQIHIV